MILTGLARLGRDAEVRFTKDGDPVANLSLAYNYGRKDSNGERPAVWVDASLWGKRAEALAPYLKKGTAVVVTLDDVHVHTFERSDKSTGHSLRGTVAMIEFAGGSRRDEAVEAAPAAQSRRQPPAPESKGAGGGKFDDFEDDIPF